MALTTSRQVMTTSNRRENIISIVTPSLNQGEFIEQTIRSVLSQEGAFFIDYIINDGGSSDESVRMIRKYEDLLRQNCDTADKSGLRFYIPRQADFEWNQCLGISYRWISQRDRGQADAINQGMRAAKGSIVAFINSDDAYCPGAFKKIVQRDWGGADFVFGEGIWIARDGRELLRYPTFNPTKYSLYYQCTLCQPTVFFRKDTFDRLGDFALQYTTAFDYEYWLRAVFRECRFRFLNEPLAKSRMHDTSKSLREKPVVAREVQMLRDRYFANSSARLSKPGLWFNYFRVELITHFSVLRLKRRLAKQV